jgi:predicted deacylase
LPLADLVVDVHSGGRSMHFLPSVNMHRVPDSSQMAEMVRMGMAWGAPYVFIYQDVAGSGLLPSYAESLGKVTLGTEMGSASQFSAATLKLTLDGLRNVLAEMGILSGVERKTGPASRLVSSELREDYIMAPAEGIFEPFVELGDAIENGQPIGQIHFIDQPAHSPMAVFARSTGFAISRRAIPLTQQGDCLLVLARASQM